MNDSTTVTALEYTGRQQRGGTITAKTAGGATDTTSVTQTGKAEFINVPTKTYNAAAKGSNSDGSDTIQITGTANTANIKVAETTGKLISGATYKIQVNAVNDESWDGKTDTGIDDDPGKDAQFTFTIDVKIPENKTEAARTLEIKLQNGNGDVTTEAITITQARGVKSYGDITLNASDYVYIRASGGTSEAPSISYSQPWGWNGKTSGGGTIISGGVITFKKDPASPWEGEMTLDTSTGAVTGRNLGTVETDGFTNRILIEVSLNGKSKSTSVSIDQEENTAIFAIDDVTLDAPADIPASGGTVSSTTFTAKGTKSYSSGSVIDNISLTEDSDECRIGFEDDITAASLGTTVTNRTKKGTLTGIVTWYGATKSASVDVYQAANTATYGDITFNPAVATEVSLKADGTQSRNMTENSNVGAKQTVTYTSGATRTEASTTSAVVFDLSPKVKTAATGFALSSDGIVSVGANPTTKARGGFVVTVTVTGEGSKTATREFTFSQQGSSSYITLTPESLTFKAAGESKTLTIESNDSWTLE